MRAESELVVSAALIASFKRDAFMDYLMPPVALESIGVPVWSIGAGIPSFISAFLFLFKKESLGFKGLSMSCKIPFSSVT